MCGIIGLIGHDRAVQMALDGLKRLEYRGYDSAGIATINKGQVQRRRAKGKLYALEEVLEKDPIRGRSAIGHTRWATHGAVVLNNAHPQASDKVTIVHNGIIENYYVLREELIEKGFEFESETDTEVVVYLITDYLNQGLSPEKATLKSLNRLQGAFALAILFADYEDLLIGARRGSPLALGHSREGLYLGSDAIALAPWASEITYLEEGDWVTIQSDGSYQIYTLDGEKVERASKQASLSGALTGKGHYQHYMKKEIFEQPSVLGSTLGVHLNRRKKELNLPKLPFDFKDIDRLTIVACGTAAYAGLVAKYWFEEYAHLPVEWDIASEFRYRSAPLSPNGATIVISQSGETIDTLEALRFAKEKGQPVLSIVNVLESVIARESDAVLQTLAGPEIGVASTKAFTTQLSVLATLVLQAAHQRGTLTSEEEKKMIDCLLQLPSTLSGLLELDKEIETIAESLKTHRDVLYISRHSLYPIALEGALKLKEISYIHAEGYAAGEMKHGPIALIDKTVPIVGLAPSNLLFDKTASNLEQAHARGGQLILLSDQEGFEALSITPVHSLCLPTVHPFILPFVYTIPIQLLAYHTAALKGTDVDQPRNLAKSVTVE